VKINEISQSQFKDAELPAIYPAVTANAATYFNSPFKVSTQILWQQNRH
jgi:hypothetical protein